MDRLIAWTKSSLKPSITSLATSLMLDRIFFAEVFDSNDRGHERLYMTSAKDALGFAEVPDPDDQEHE